MKRASILLAPPLAFVLAALLAWLAGSPAGKTIALDDNVSRSPRQRETAAASSGDPVAIAAQFENEMLIDRAPPKEVHDAEGMEAMIKSDNRTRSFMHGGMGWMSYSREWAEESPAEMFAWLIHEGGSDFKEREGAASILFEEWVEKEMEAALAAVPKISDTNIRRKALASSLEVLCQSNPNRARELMMQNLGLFPPDGDGKSSVFNSYDTGKTTCEMLLSLPPGEARTHLLANLLTGMANWSIGEESKSAISIWKQAPESLRRELAAAGFASGKDNAASFDGLEDLMRERAEKSGDPRSAEQFMETQGPAWAKRDLAGAMDWAQAHLKGKARVERSAGLFESAASQDFDTALQIWQELPDGILKDRAAGAMSKGAPPNRKAEAEAVIQSLSERDRDLAR